MQCNKVSCLLKIYFKLKISNKVEYGCGYMIVYLQDGTIVKVSLTQVD